MDQKLEICGVDVCTDQQIVIPIHSRGTVLYFKTSTPTQKELDTLSHFHLTLENEWNPHKVRLTRNVMSASRVVNGDQTDNIGEYLHDRFYQSLVLVNGEVRCMAQVETAILDTRGFQSSKRHSQLNAETLSNIWHIGLDTAKKTIEVTTQQGARSAVLPLARNYRMDMHYHLPRLRGRFYTDTVFGRYSSLTVFTNKSFLCCCLSNGVQSSSWKSAEGVH
jgi:hypothetical protein